MGATCGPPLWGNDFQHSDALTPILLLFCLPLLLPPLLSSLSSRRSRPLWRRPPWGANCRRTRTSRRCVEGVCQERRRATRPTARATQRTQPSRTKVVRKRPSTATHIHTHTRTRTCAHTHTHTHTRTHTIMHAHTHTRTHTQKESDCLFFSPTPTPTHTYTHSLYKKQLWH